MFPLKQALRTVGFFVAVVQNNFSCTRERERGEQLLGYIYPLFSADCFVNWVIQELINFFFQCRFELGSEAFDSKLCDCFMLESSSSFVDKQTDRREELLAS
jgi:hypothetical protein